MKKSKYLILLLANLILIGSCKKELPPDPAPTAVTSAGNSITGTSWANVGGALDGSAAALFAFDSKLFIAGNFFHVGSSQATGCAYWDGATINPIYLSGVGGTGFSSFGEHNSLLFGGGGFNQSFGLSDCAQWDGTTWVEGSYSINSNVYAIQSFNNNLYIGGYFNSFNSISYNHIAQHNGSAWQTVGAGFNNEVSALAVYNNELYAGGSFTASGSTTTNHIAKWNGTAWVAVGTNGLDGTVNALVVYNGELYAAGNFSTADGNPARYIAKWNGTSWSNVNGSLTGGFNGAKALCVYNGELFVGGDFTGAGATSVTNIARLNGSTWTAMGSNVTDIVSALAVYNNSLYAVTMTYTGSNYLRKFQ